MIREECGAGIWEFYSGDKLVLHACILWWHLHGQEQSDEGGSWVLLCPQDVGRRIWKMRIALFNQQEEDNSLTGKEWQSDPLEEVWEIPLTIILPPSRINKTLSLSKASWKWEICALKLSPSHSETWRLRREQWENRGILRPSGWSEGVQSSWDSASWRVGMV